MGKKSRTKGIAAELEVVDLLRLHDIDNGAQRHLECQGVDTGRDVDLPMLKHFSVQCKRRARVSITDIRKGLEEAQRGCKDGYVVPVVFHRSDRGDWQVTMSADEWCNIISEWRDLRFG